MARTEIHCQDCLLELGEDFRQVHEWLDEFARQNILSHRKYRHHIEGIEKVRKIWGDRAARAAEIHIRKDWGGSLPTKEQAECWIL